MLSVFRVFTNQINAHRENGSGTDISFQNAFLVINEFRCIGVIVVILAYHHTMRL